MIPVWVWGVPLTPFTRDQALKQIEQLVADRTPSYFITANLHYAMLTDRSWGVARSKSACSVHPGRWNAFGFRASRRQKRCLPERVAGSDLLFWICERAAIKGLNLPSRRSAGNRRCRGRELVPTLSRSANCRNPIAALWGSIYPREDRTLCANSRCETRYLICGFRPAERRNMGRTAL